MNIISKEDTLALVVIARHFLTVALHQEASQVISDFIDDGQPHCGYDPTNDEYWINCVDRRGDTLYGIAGSHPTLKLSSNAFKALKEMK